MEALEALSKTSAPAPLKNLREKPVRFDKVVDKQNMAQAVLEIL